MKNGLTLLILSILISSFSGRKVKPYAGFDLKEFEKSLNFIPSGVLALGQVLSDRDSFPFKNGDYDNLRLTDSNRSGEQRIASFYCSATEVSNGQYLEFLREMQVKSPATYPLLLPDTTVWDAQDESYEALTHYYFRHPYFSHHPVVGISLDQAMSYCDWLTDKYHREEKRTHAKVSIRLPTTSEWTYAACAGNMYNIYPWEGDGFLDKKGHWRANFKVVDQGKIGVMDIPDPFQRDTSARIEVLVSGSGGPSRFGLPHNSSVRSDVNSSDVEPTVPVKSYEPNNFGLFCMGGNVEELVSDVGIVKGGSWNDPGSYLPCYIHQTYDSSNVVSAERGFRIVMEVKN